MLLMTTHDLQRDNPMSYATMRSRFLAVTTMLIMSAFSQAVHAQAPSAPPSAPAVSAAAPTTPSVRVTNTAFLNYFVSLSDTLGRANNFDVARAYINVFGKFDNGISTRVTADIYRPADGTLTYRLKYAFVAWNPGGSPYTVKFGAIQTPWMDWEETLWDYRFQGPVAMDRAGYLTSSDLGIGVDGSYNMDKVNFQATAVNGEGYSKPGGDQGKDAQVRASLRLLNTDDPSRVGGLRVTAYGQYGKMTGGGPRNRFIGMLSYRSKALTLAGEAAVTKDRLASGTDVDGKVFSAFGVAHVGQTPVAVIGRVDHVDPDTHAAGDAYTTLIVGPSYQVARPLRILLDLDHTMYQADVLPAAVQVNKTRLMLQAQVAF
jgi:hypothetical protein